MNVFLVCFSSMNLFLVCFNSLNLFIVCFYSMNVFLVCFSSMNLFIVWFYSMNLFLNSNKSMSSMTMTKSTWVQLYTTLTMVHLRNTIVMLLVSYRVRMVNNGLYKPWGNWVCHRYSLCWTRREYPPYV